MKILVIAAIAVSTTVMGNANPGEYKLLEGLSAVARHAIELGVTMPPSESRPQVPVPTENFPAGKGPQVGMQG